MIVHFLLTVNLQKIKTNNVMMLCMNDPKTESIRSLRLQITKITD